MDTIKLFKSNFFWATFLILTLSYRLAVLIFDVYRTQTNQQTDIQICTDGKIPKLFQVKAKNNVFMKDGFS